jgi:NAD(P)-dependent dehydrogenase (short-subunit alcohol dehydrogenase family)
MPTVLITGSNRGLGLEFATQYAAAGWEVIAACREPAKADALRAIQPPVRIHALEVSDAGSIEATKLALKDRPIDLLIHNAGLGQAPQTLGAIDYDLWQRMFEVHVIAPIRLTEALLENVKLGQQKKVVAITSGLGSFAYLTENGFGFLGSMHPYRSTKAALNMAMRGLAADVAPYGISVLALSPGWVRTDMGGPNAPLAPEESISKMRATIEKLGPANSGSFVGHDGAPIQW